MILFSPGFSTDEKLMPLEIRVIRIMEKESASGFQVLPCMLMAVKTQDQD